MLMTQRDLINSIARQEGITVATVRKVFESAEQIINDYLSSATSSDAKKVRIYNGLTVESKFVPSRVVKSGIFKDHVSDDKVKVSAKITQEYQEKIAS